LVPGRVRFRDSATGRDAFSKGGDMSDEPLNLSSGLLRNEELDVQAHIKQSSDESEPEPEDKDEVEAHLLDQNLLQQNLLDESL
jgi:hypothetical protein